MSIKATRWVYDNCPCKGAQRAVHLALADHHNSTRGDDLVWPGVENLAAKTGYVERQVRRVLKDMAAGPFLRLHKQGRKAVGASEYVFNFPSQADILAVTGGHLRHLSRTSAAQDVRPVSSQSVEAVSQSEWNADGCADGLRDREMKKIKNLESIVAVLYQEYYEAWWPEYADYGESVCDFAEDIDSQGYGPDEVEARIDRLNAHLCERLFLSDEPINYLIELWDQLGDDAVAIAA